MQSMTAEFNVFVGLPKAMKSFRVYVTLSVPLVTSRSDARPLKYDTMKRNTNGNDE